MRLAIVTDIHGNLAALEAVAADIHRRGVDQIVNLGDSLSGPLLPLETAQFLMTEGWPSLAGNHERQILTHSPERRGASDKYAHSQLTSKEFAWLRSLAPSLRLTPEIFLCHGTPSSDTEYFLETVKSGAARPATSAEIEARLGNEVAPLVACGHTHVQRVVHTKRGQLVVNPGSVGLPAYDDIYPVPHAIETGSPDARYAIAEQLQDGWGVALLSVPYNYKSMAQLARLRNRPEWEYALLTGYLSRRRASASI
jgi:predicted phosphodiesterase